MKASQSRAGRALLDMTQTQLAAAAGLGQSTVIDFERERRDVAEASVQAIRTALETAGVVFLDDGTEVAGGPGVRLRGASDGS